MFGQNSVLFLSAAAADANLAFFWATKIRCVSQGSSLSKVDANFALKATAQAKLLLLRLLAHFIWLRANISWLTLDAILLLALGHQRRLGECDKAPTCCLLSSLLPPSFFAPSSFYCGEHTHTRRQSMVVCVFMCAHTQSLPEAKKANTQQRRPTTTDDERRASWMN